MYNSKDLSNKLIYKIDAYFKAANYLSVAQLYLLDNPLLRRKLSLEDIKPNVVGHWGTAPTQNFIYVHLNRIINKYKLNMIYISGPGHGGQAMVANTYLEGTYSEIYPDITEDEEGLKKLCKQFSFPGGVSSHVAPETPGSINEGGELGYSLAHAYGAVLDSPKLIATCVVGDGEAETGPLSTSWMSNKFINPKTDGTVLPILNLNGYKIANPTVFGRMSKSELIDYFNGCGYEPFFVEGSEAIDMHKKMGKTLDKVIKRIYKIKKEGLSVFNKWPMIILRTPKGWTGPSFVNGKKICGTFRAHQIPVVVNEENINNIKILEKWLLSYHPHELFDEKGRLINELKELAPKGKYRMGSNPNTNGGLLTRDLIVPDLKNYGLKIKNRGAISASDMTELGTYIKDVIKLNESNKNFRIFGPDELASNRLHNVFEITERKWNMTIKSDDEYLNSTGRVMDGMLSEHLCEGWLEGYLLTGRYGFIHSYEAFIRIIDSMTSQHAKWLKVCNQLSWRKEIPSLNYILTSHCWQQDHNGYTHQDPGFLNHLINKKADMVRMYLPYDANSLISCFDHIITTKNYINVIVASKHPRPQWLNMDEAIKHCEKGIGEWEWASTTEKTPNIILASAGDTPTLETLAAISLLKEMIPNIKLKMINVVDLTKLFPDFRDPHGLSNDEYDKLFPKDIPVIFNFHGYPSLIHQLTYKRNNHENIHVHGYKEEGTITTPFDMRVQNGIDRYHIILDVLKYISPKYKKEIEAYCNERLEEHKNYIREHGKDMPDIISWNWN